ncbi:MAG: copper-binding protein [Balneolales bacterium]|nr:copper-binding protein [Balneolales bacterium]
MMNTLGNKKNALLMMYLMAISGIWLTACGGETEVSDQPDIADAAPVHEARGFITAMDQELSTVSIVHEQIPDVMNAMRMSLLVEDFSKLDSFAEGDIISFEMFRRGNSWYASGFEKLPDDTELDLEERLLNMRSN